MGLNRSNVEVCDRLFVYGTLQSGQSRNHYLDGLSYEKAFLLGYRKVQPEHLSFPFIIIDKSSRVEGEIYYGLLESHWSLLDRIEGEGSLYHRIMVEVELISSREKKDTFVYFPSKSLIEYYLEEIR